MSDDRMFERDARAWLELGPTQAPAPTVQRALQVIDATPQHRPLHIPWRIPQLHSQTRLMLAAAIGVIAILAAGALIIGRQQMLVGTPSPTPTVQVSPSPSPISLQPIQAMWASVGTRVDPIGNGANPPQVESMALDQAALRIDTYRGDVTSAASLTGDGNRLTLRMEAPQEMLTRLNWDCTTGDAGTYDEHLSPDGVTLTLALVGDSCRTRAAMLAGDWTRWTCPSTFQYATCDHVGALVPGRHVSPLFRPFGGVTGQFAWTAGNGWAEFSHPPGWDAPNSGAEGKPEISLTRLDAVDRRPALTMYSTLMLSPSRAVGVPCQDGGDAPSGFAADVAHWLEAQPYLTVFNRKPVTVGGLGGVQFDVSLVPEFNDPCSGAAEVEIFQEEPGAGVPGIFLDESDNRHARLIILDSGDGLLVIAVSAPDLTTLDTRFAEAMPAVNSFEFIR